MQPHSKITNDAKRRASDPDEPAPRRSHWLVHKQLKTFFCLEMNLLIQNSMKAWILWFQKKKHRSHKHDLLTRYILKKGEKTRKEKEHDRKQERKREIHGARENRREEMRRIDGQLPEPIIPSRRGRRRGERRRFELPRCLWECPREEYRNGRQKIETWSSDLPLRTSHLPCLGPRTPRFVMTFQRSQRHTAHSFSDACSLQPP